MIGILDAKAVPQVSDQKRNMKNICSATFSQQISGKNSESK